MTVDRRPSLEEIFNSPTLKEIRRQLISGEWPESCKRCFKDETRRGTSRRKIEQNHRKDLEAQLRKQTREDGYIEKILVKESDYRLGNKCNLHCRMCTPYSSSRCLEYWNQVPGDFAKISPSEKERLGNMNWFDQGYLLDDLKRIIHSVDKMHFGGGEPLISSQLEPLLEYAISQNLSSKMALSFNTNFTVLPPRLLELFSKFGHIKFLVSLDGVGKLNEYIRLGSRWDDIEKNIKAVDEFAAKFPQTEVIISTTVQALNVFDIDQIVSFLRMTKNIVPIPNLINLCYPAILSTRVLPLEQKKLASEKLTALYNELEGTIPPHYDYLRQNILGVIDYMQEDHSHLYEDFLLYNQGVDLKYNKKMQEVASRLFVR